MSKYWVGGSGNWSDDDNHWATSSGGSGGDGNLPTSSDSVFFDSSSGFTETETLDQSQTGLTTKLTFGTGSVQKLGQTFKAGQTGPISKVSLKLGNNYLSADAIRLQIYSAGSGEPGELLATADSDVSGGGMDWEVGLYDKDFEFTDGPRLVSGTTYWFVLSRTGSLDESNTYYSQYEEENYSDGQLYYYDSLDEWNGGLGLGNADLYFQEYYFVTDTVNIDSSLPPVDDFTANTGVSFTIGKSNGSTAIYIYGSYTGESGLTWTSNVNTVFNGTGSETVTCNGGTLRRFDIYGDGTFTLQDDMDIESYVYVENGTLDANDHDVTAGSYYWYGDTGYTPTINMGSGTWTANTESTTLWEVDDDSGSTVTINPESSKIYLAWAGSGSLEFYGGDKTYNNMELGGDGAGSFYINDSNTFNDFKARNTAGARIYFEGEHTTTITGDFDVEGVAGSLIEIRSSYLSNGNTTLSKTGGTIECDYLDIQYCNATGGAHWYAGDNSTDSGNNRGWIFTDRKYPLPPFRS